MSEAIEAVLFDYGLVLTASPDPAAWAGMQRITGLPEEAFSAAYWAPRHDYDRGFHTGREYWAVVGQHAGLTLAAAQITSLIAADTALWTRVNQPMVGWARRLQAAGIRTGILSNLGDEMMHGVLRDFPSLGDFQFLLWSHTLKMSKPEPGIYLHAARGLGVPAERILFIDDREDNIAGAKAVGMQTICYPDQEIFEREMIDRGWDDLWRVGEQNHH